MTNDARSLGALVASVVVVVGDCAGLDSLLPPETRVVAVEPRNIGGLAVPAALVVLDGRTHSTTVLAEVRHAADVSRVPALLIASAATLAQIEAVGADDVLAPPFDRADAGRVRVLLELGRTRFALWFAEQALDHSASALTIGDASLPDVPLVHATAVFERITGYAAEQALGQSCRFLQGPDTDATARATLGAAVRARRQARVTLKNHRKDGTPFWNEVTVFPVCTPAGQPLEWIGGVQHDVTQLVEARAEADRLLGLLRQRQAFDQAILDGVNVGIITTDGAGVVTFVNRMARELLRCQAAPSGSHVRELLGLHESLESLGRRAVRERHVARLQEQELELELSVTRAEPHGPADLGFFCIFHDRTSEKQLEMERRRFERLAAMGTMVAGFAHEIRNPMASLRSLAESLDEELAESGVRLPHVERMLKVLERVERLVRSSLLFGRPSPPRPAAHSVSEVLHAAAAAVSVRTRVMGAAICLETAEDLPAVFADEDQIVQVLVILLNNALDATGDPHRVILRAHPEASSTDGRPVGGTPTTSGFVRVEVHDDGAGIPPQVLGRIFDPFFTTKASGTGLGLSIAQQLATENGARIELTSTVGGPTTFSVLLPVAAPGPTP